MLYINFYLLHSLQNNLERQKNIIHNYKNIINFNRNVQKECKKNINECKLQVENKQYDRVFCEFDKLDQEKKIDKLHVKKKNYNIFTQNHNNEYSNIIISIIN